MTAAMRMLVSVRSSAEALLAAAGGADFIDCKEPSAGALGGLPVATISAIVAALRGSGLAVSATIGDWPPVALQPVLAHVAAVAACGVDYVKVGVERGPHAAALLQALAASGHAVVPVFVADRGIDDALVAVACSLRFPALMVDTADKAAGSLFDLVDTAALRRFVGRVRASGALAGLAGALRREHVPQLMDLAPDFSGWRSAVCAGDRTGQLDALRLGALAQALREQRLPDSVAHTTETP